MAKMFKYHWRAIAWVVIIILGCMLPSSDLQVPTTFLSRLILRIERFIGLDFDKLVHFTLYFVFTLLLLAGFTRQYSTIKFKAHMYSMLIAIGCGAAIEILQPIVGRSRDWHDMAANALGVAAGLLLYYPARWVLRNIL